MREPLDVALTFPAEMNEADITALLTVLKQDFDIIDDGRSNFNADWVTIIALLKDGAEIVGGLGALASLATTLIAWRNKTVRSGHPTPVRIKVSGREEINLEFSSDDEIRYLIGFGTSVPPHIVTEIEDTKNGVINIDSQIKDGKTPSSKSQEFYMDTISILFVSADPTDASRLRLGEEFREIQEKLKLAKLRDHFKLELPQLSIRPADISQALLDTQPQIVHFSGHGSSTGALCFENQVGQTQIVQPDALAALFEQFANQIYCVLLNACYSDAQANAIAEHVEFVIGMNQAIGDRAAIAFAIGFYQALGAGRSIEEAYKLGNVQIRLQGIPEHLTPVLVKKGRTQA